jgi:predicted nuclease of predicted toxin-antitoxin system
MGKETICSMKLLVDEHIPLAVIHGVLRRLPTADMARAVEVGLLGAEDPDVLAWAATENRILLTKDRSTMSLFAYRRIQEGLAMPGVILITQGLSIGSLIEELVIILECATTEEFNNRIYTIP